MLQSRVAKEELMRRQNAAVSSNFSMEIDDKTILMNGFGVFKL